MAITVSTCDDRKRDAIPREATRSDSGAGVFEPPSHFFSRGESWMFRDHGALAEDHEVRNGSYSESGAQGRLCFRIDLQDQGSARHLAREVAYQRCGRSTRAAPRCPEVDEHGHPRSCDDVSKGGLVHVQWLTDRRQRRLAGPASNDVGQVPSLNPVLRSAGWAGSDHRKSHVDTPCQGTGGSKRCAERARSQRSADATVAVGAISRWRGFFPVVRVPRSSRCPVRRRSA